MCAEIAVLCGWRELCFPGGAQSFSVAPSLVKHTEAAFKEGFGLSRKCEAGVFQSRGVSTSACRSKVSYLRVCEEFQVALRFCGGKRSLENAAER